MSYVILSRITSLDQLYLKEFNQKKIYCSSVAKKEAQRLRKRAINMQETEWDKQAPGFIRITSLNARSLKQHPEDLQKDKLIMASDIIAVQETWLETDPRNPITSLNEYFLHGHSKGIALFTRMRPITVENFQSVHCSIIKASFSQLDLLNVYRFSADTGIQEFTEEVIKLLDKSRTQIIVGDMNINLLQSPWNPFTDSLEQIGFQQMVTRPTHVLGGLIDHVYFYSPDADASCTIHKYHTVFWSDHTCQSIIVRTSEESTGN